MDDRGVVRAPYPAVLRLYAIADERWAEIESHYIQVDLLGVGPRRFLNCVYAWCVMRMDQETRERWEEELHSPLPGQKKATDSMVEAEGAAFMAAMQAHKRVTGG